MQRITITVDDDTADIIRDFAKCSGDSVSGLLRGMLHELTPMFSRSVDLYRMAQDAGAEGRKNLLQTASKLESTRPAQQELLRSYKSLVAQVGEALGDGQDD